MVSLLTWAGVASGFVLALTGLVLLVADPRRAGSRFFSYFIVAWGSEIILFNSLELTADPGLEQLVVGVAFALILVEALFLVHFIVRFTDADRTGHRWWTYGMAGFVGVVGSLMAVQPGLFLGGGGATTATSVLIILPNFAALFVTLYILVDRYLFAELGLEQREIAIVASALSLYASYTAGFYVAFYGIAPPPSLSMIETWSFVGLFTAGSLLVLWLAFRVTTQPNQRRSRTLDISIVASLLVPAILGVGTGAASVLVEDLRLDLFGILRIGTALLITYGLLKFELFDIDLRLKAGIRGSTVSAAFAGAFLVASETIERFLPVDGTLYGVGAAVAVGLALRPVQGFAERFANLVLPTVQDDPVYMSHRKVEIYQAALRDAVGSDGHIPYSQELMLARLRERMGLSERDHDLLLGALGHVEQGATSEEVSAGRTVLDRYHLERRLGEGGQAVTYLARDLDEDRHVVVKALFVGASSVRDALAEARALLSVEHPSILELLAVETLGDRVLLVMEYAEGGTLGDELEDRALGEDEVVDLASDLLGALGALHDASMVHRDVKPSNVLITGEGRYKLGDLGIAQRLVSGSTTMASDPFGDAVGTAAYMSPEQAQGKPVDERSDLFSAAVTIYEALTGDRLHRLGEHASPLEIRMTVAGWSGFDMELPRHPNLSGWFEKALARDPAERFESAGEMADALVSAMQPTPVRPG